MLTSRHKYANKKVMEGGGRRWKGEMRRRYDTHQQAQICPPDRGSRAGRQGVPPSEVLTPPNMAMMSVAPSARISSVELRRMLPDVALPQRAGASSHSSPPPPLPPLPPSQPI